MREQARILRITKLIGQLWDYYPDHRLGQLLVNFVFGQHTDIFFQDIFFQDDDKTEKILIKLIKAIKFYNKTEKNNAKAHIKKL